MSDFDHLSESLADEVLSEMAENFFGSRRDMDERIDRFHEMMREAAQMQGRVERHAEMLHFLLLDEEGATGFYEAVGVEPSALPLCLHCTIPPEAEKMPFALTRKGRYRKLLERAYGRMAEAVQEYLHGRTYPDPDDPRRKRVSLNYTALKRLEGRLNRAIDRLNGQGSVSDALHYVRGLDPAELEREKIAGAPAFAPPGGLDGEFCYQPVDLDAFGLKEFPELPNLGRVRAEVRAFAEEFFVRNREQVAAMFVRLRSASGADGQESSPNS